MTIPTNALGAASTVAPEAEKRSTVQNPYIPLRDLESLCSGDEILMECLRDVVSYALRYTETVCRFKQIVLGGQHNNESGERKEIEKLRTGTHDAAIDSVNALSRTLKKLNLDISWMRRVTAEERAGYGKFLVILAFEVVLQSQPQELHEV